MTFLTRFYFLNIHDENLLFSSDEQLFQGSTL